MKSVLREIFFRIALSLATLCLFLLLAEAVFRFTPLFRKQYSLFHYFQKDATSWLNDRSLRPSALLGFEYIPGRGDCNSMGFIGPEYPFRKAKNVFRILILGDSITARDGYIRFLEKKMNGISRLPYRFEFWNAGVDGYAVQQYARLLEQKGLHIKPDMIIIGMCLNDFDMYMPVFYERNGGIKQFFIPASQINKYIAPFGKLFEHSYLFRFLILRLNTVLNEDDLTYAERLKNEGEYYMRFILKLCKKKNISLHCVIFPTLRSKQEYEGWEREGYKTIRQTLEQLSISFLDLAPFFPEEKRFSLRSTSEDFIHPNQEGHQIAANAIYEYLLNSEFKN